MPISKSWICDTGVSHDLTPFKNAFLPKMMLELMWRMSLRSIESSILALPSINLLIQMVLHALFPVWPIINSIHMFAYCLLRLITRCMYVIKYCIYFKLKWFCCTKNYVSNWEAKWLSTWGSQIPIYIKRKIYMDCNSDLPWPIQDWYN